MEIGRGRDCAEDFDLLETPRANRGHPVNPLQHALRQQDSGAAQQQAMFLEQVGRDDQVGDAGFVLERSEDDAVRRGRTTLAAGLRCGPSTGSG